MNVRGTRLAPLRLACLSNRRALGIFQSEGVPLWYHPTLSQAKSTQVLRSTLQDWRLALKGRQSGPQKKHLSHCRRHGGSVPGSAIAVPCDLGKSLEARLLQVLSTAGVLFSKKPLSLLSYRGPYPMCTTVASKHLPVVRYVTQLTEAIQALKAEPDFQ